MVAHTLSQQKSLPKSRSIPSTSDNPFTTGEAASSGCRNCTMLTVLTKSAEMRKAALHDSAQATG